MHIHKHIYMYTHTHKHICRRATSSSTAIQSLNSTRLCAPIKNNYIHICIYSFIYMYICVYTYTYTYVHTHTHICRRAASSSTAIQSLTSTRPHTSIKNSLKVLCSY